MGETLWAFKTNKGKVVYKRKPHVWTEKDIERIVKAYEAQETFPDVPMMSQLADRILFWIARRLGLDEAAGFVIRPVMRLYEILRGINSEPKYAGRTTTEEQELLDWVNQMVGGSGVPATREENLAFIKQILLSMVSYIDEELRDE
jgi:hypothetical protein